DFDDRQHRTRRIAYLPQFQPVAWALACRDIVRLGRVPYGEDEAAVLAAMQFCDVAHFADMAIDTISGGEQARVLLARVLAGAADIYLLDEPVRSLDLRRQVQVMALLKAQARMGKAVVIVLHDLSLAARFCDEVVLLNEQSIIQQGAPQSVFTAQQLHSIFGVEMDMVWNKSA
ncbi:MAG: ABC transporter ATP-binding protein, partial [Alphaproteobacteria bacterium]|nr:ABC transporter ATP-binding protein [Alphaproteobacteria bacterium]